MASKYTVKEVAQTFKRVSQFSLGDMLLNVIGYKGFPYPGGFIPDAPAKYKGDGYEYPGEAASEKTNSDFGSTLRKKDAQGRWYFMPVVLEHKGTEYEIPTAVK